MDELEPITDAKALELIQLATTAGECMACPLHDGRKKVVFGNGNQAAELMVIGEAPGADEDESGEPFVGDAGRLLNKMLASIGFARAEVYIANVVKCRPPENRKPKPIEVGACCGYLGQQIEIVRPKVILALGATAVSTLLCTKTGITQLRGKWQEYKGMSATVEHLRIDIMPTFHPAYLLRVPDAKREVWQDLQAVAEKLGRTVAA